MPKRKKRIRSKNSEEIDSDKEAKLYCKALEKSSLEITLNNYTKEQIQEFPFWLRCCYYIQAFNKSVAPESIEEWAKEVGFLQFDVDECFYNDAVKVAIGTAQCFIKFVTEERERFKQGRQVKVWKCRECGDIEVVDLNSGLREGVQCKCWDHRPIFFPCDIHMEEFDGELIIK